jgi:hypothetical protein
VRRSDCTISLEGRRFEIPSRFRHLSRVSVRFARWDLSVVHLVDAMTSVALDRIYPLDKEKNASGQRRALSPGDSPASEPRSPAGIAPLMKKLLADHAATGLPPAYIPLDADDDDPKETP